MDYKDILKKYEAYVKASCKDEDPAGRYAQAAGVYRAIVMGILIDLKVYHPEALDRLMEDSSYMDKAIKENELTLKTK